MTCFSHISITAMESLPFAKLSLKLFGTKFLQGMCLTNILVLIIISPSCKTDSTSILRRKGCEEHPTVTGP
jgi:hypothetical protein